MAHSTYNSRERIMEHAQREFPHALAIVETKHGILVSEKSRDRLYHPQCHARAVCLTLIAERSV